MDKKVWFQTPLGQRHEIPERDEYPIVVGRVKKSGDAPDRVEIPQSEYSMTVSRNHAHLYRNEDGNWEIEDAGSSHGLTLNGQTLPAGERHPLQPGDKVGLGKYELTFMAEGLEQDDDESTGDQTMILGDFQPGSPQPDPAPAESDLPETEQLWLDAWLEGRHQALAFPQIPGVAVWTVGRQVRKEPRPRPGAEVEDHVQLPNLEATKSISRRHARIRRLPEEGWTIESLSAQGLTLNGRKLPQGEQSALQPGDKIGMGKQLLVFRQGPLEQVYTESDFATDHEPATADNADETPTREIPVGLLSGSQATLGGEEKPWGYLVENKLLDPQQYPLTKRKTKIGSHPLNMDIKMEGGGMTDYHALISWGSKDCRIVSKATNSPVRVDHAPYRTSPPLREGNIITLGNREFHFRIVGDPPVASSAIVVSTIRRSILAFVLILVLSVVIALVGIKVLTPDPAPSASIEQPQAAELVNTVVADYGLEGLAMLARSPANEGEAGLENKALFAAFADLNEAHRLIHKLPAQRFDSNVAEIERLIESGKQVFELADAGLSASQAEWFQQDIENVFADRRQSAYSVQWQDFLTALEEDNIANARRQLDSLTHFPEERLARARRIVDQWVAAAKATNLKDEQDLLREFRRASTESRGSSYIAEEAARLDALLADFESIETDSSDPARALQRSPKWESYRNHVTTLRATLGLLEHYQTGDVAAFNALVGDIDPGAQGDLINTMKENLADWASWKQRFEAAPNPLSNFRLLGELQQLQLSLRGSLDEQAPLMQEVARRIERFSAGRGDQARALRRQAEQMDDGFDKLMKLLDAYDFDPNDAALQELDNLGSRLCGEINSQGNVAAYKDRLQRAVNRFQALIDKGVMNPDAVVSRRQMQKLLDTLEE